MPFKPNSFFKFNVNHYDFFINLRDLHKIFYTLYESIKDKVQISQILKVPLEVVEKVLSKERAVR